MTNNEEGPPGPAKPHRSYLDTASSTPLHPAAREVMTAALDQGYADPRRLHPPARTARLLLDNARQAVAETLGVRPDEVTFTATGTDAVHRGLLGLRRGRERVGPVIVSSAVEHSAIAHAAAWVPGEHVEVGVDAWGRVDQDAFVLAAGAPGVAVAALQSANHEVGTVQPVEAVAAALWGPEAGGVPLFVDARASMGRAPLPRGWDALAGSAHQWGGPAGVGVLLVRKGARWRNPFPGDDRIDERTSGFENVPAALAAAAALQAVVAEQQEVAERQHALIATIRAAVARIADIDVVGDPVDRLPHLLTFSCLYADGEALVDGLARRGFDVASGSACTASSLQPSRVLAAMGALTHGNVRLSLGRESDTAEVDALLSVLPDVVASARAGAGG
ncbi:MAG: aminotransferase class V-fold PLP-dependent enzyme [Nocardioides sp.]|nr:aminotransferase class V-fold PLP-dependent enzyme [Nocardioides sp.]